MKRLYLLFFTTISLMSFSAQALTCENIFATLSQPLFTPTESSRLQITKTADDDMNSKLFIEASSFSKDTNQAAIELIRLLVQNSVYKLEDKNVLTKNKLLLGVPIQNGYFLELTYESKSNTHPRFILQDKIELITPSGKAFKLTENLIHPDEMRIHTSEFDIKNYIQQGVHLTLKAPLIIDGALLKKFSQLAEYFEYFEKNEIAKIFKSNSMLKIETLFKIRKAQKVFFKVLIKEPFKFIIGGSLMFAVFNTQVIFPHQNKQTLLNQPPAITQNYVASIIHQLPIPENKPQIKEEFQNLQQEAIRQLNSKTSSNLNPIDIRLDADNFFSRQYNIFVFDKINKASGLTQTYIVFSNDISKNQNLAMQFFAIEVNPFHYQKLIAYIKHQGSFEFQKNKKDSTQ